MYCIPTSCQNTRKVLDKKPALAYNGIDTRICVCQPGLIPTIRTHAYRPRMKSKVQITKGAIPMKDCCCGPSNWQKYAEGYDHYIHDYMKVILVVDYQRFRVSKLSFDAFLMCSII